MQDIRPLISVVIATKGERESLLRAIDSVLSQTFENWEIVIVCNANSRMLHLLPVDPRIRIVHQIEDGIYQNFNLGIDSSVGHYISFLNDDDWYLPNFLYSAMEAITANQSEATYGNTLLFSEDEKVRFVKSRNKLSRGYLLDFLGAYHTTFLISKDCFVNYGQFMTHSNSGKELKLANDYLWFVNALQKGLKSVKSTEIIGNFSLGGASSMSRLEMIREGKEIAVSCSRNFLEQWFICVVWNFRLGYNLIKVHYNSLIQIFS
jgi:glycosyltransferase involved in cell wall biosynthesis